VSDFCLSRPILAEVARRSELMNRVMARMGIDAAAVACAEDMACYEARIKCLACIMERQCLQRLERAQAEELVEPPEFCANAGFFRRCREGVRT